MHLTDYHSKTNAREIPVRCNPDQSDVVLHDVPIFKPLRRVVFELCLFFAFRAFSRPLTALDISTGPLARGTFQTAGPVRASTFYLSLARTGHLDICRATRFQIVLPRTKINHRSFRAGARPTSRQFSRNPFATARCQRVASRSWACQSNTLTSVFRSCRTRYFNANIRDASGHFSPRSTCHGSE